MKYFIAKIKNTLNSVEVFKDVEDNVINAPFKTLHYSNSIDFEFNYGNLNITINEIHKEVANGIWIEDTLEYRGLFFQAYEKSKSIAKKLEKSNIIYKVFNDETPIKLGVDFDILLNKILND